MKNNKISPVGLKGNQINERMKELMGIAPINENKSTSTVELTKMGPDGNPYAIVRENREWYIKKADKTENLVAEDFKYIGGLQNKKMEAYPSYSAALKRLNLKFNSLAEAHNFTGEFNIVENDNLLSEAGIAGFSEMKGMGFSGEGNLEGNQPMAEPEDDGLSDAEQAIEDMMAREKIGHTYTDDTENQTSNDDAYSKAFDSMGGSIEEMMAREELKGGQFKLDVDKDGEIKGSDLAALRAGKKVEEAEEMSDKDKKFAALAEPKDKITYADKIAGAKMNEGKMSIAKLLESIDEEENAKSEVKKKV